MKDLFRPTLVRRVFLALIVAFAIAWVALQVQMVRENVNEEAEGQSLSDFQTDVLGQLKQLDTADAAHAYMLGAVGETNRLARGTRRAIIFATLADQHGNTVFSNILPQNTPLAQLLANVPAGSLTSHDGFLTRRQDTARWSLTVARHRHRVLAVLLDDWPQLSGYMLIAFPLVLLPVWVAVSRGLRPLRQLSERIAAKGDDLSPLQLTARYAELTPLIAALDRLLAQLRGKMQRERAFLQDAAHELRTPIAVISAQAHVLSMAVGAAARQEAEWRMDHAIARAAHLIQQLLQLAQVDEGGTAQLSICDIAELARNELALQAPAALARRLSLRLEAPETLTARLDQPAMLSVLHNLLDNAIKYTQADGHVMVELRQVDGRLLLAVSDDGPGIAEYDKPKLFERFHRGLGHDVPGSGLGLAIVKQASIKLGGKIQLSAGLADRGCCFTLTLHQTG